MKIPNAEQMIEDIENSAIVVDEKELNRLATVKAREMLGRQERLSRESLNTLPKELQDEARKAKAAERQKKKAYQDHLASPLTKQAVREAIIEWEHQRDSRFAVIPVWHLWNGIAEAHNVPSQYVSERHKELVKERVEKRGYALSAGRISRFQRLLAYDLEQANRRLPVGASRTQKNMAAEKVAKSYGMSIMALLELLSLDLGARMLELNESIQEILLEQEWPAERFALFAYVGEAELRKHMLDCGLTPEELDEWDDWVIYDADSSTEADYERQGRLAERMMQTMERVRREYGS